MPILQVLIQFQMNRTYPLQRLIRFLNNESRLIRIKACQADTIPWRRMRGIQKAFLIHMEASVLRIDFCPAIFFSFFLISHAVQETLTKCEDFPDHGKLVYIPHFA